MKRPLFYTGTACFAALAVVFYLGTGFYIALLLAAVAALLLVSALSKNFKKYSVLRAAVFSSLLGFALGGVLFWQHNFLRVQVLRNINGRTVEVDAVVTEVLPNTRTAVYEVYGNIYCDGITYKNYRATFSDYGDNTLKTGEHVSFTAKIKVNDFSTFYGSYNITTGQLVGGYITGKAVQQAAGKYPVRAALAVFRQRLIKSVYALDEDLTADLLIALITGDRARLSDELSANLGYSGLTHLVAVSGLHISVILYFVTQLLKKTYIPIKLRYAIEIAAVWLVAGFTGFNYTVVRAAVMLSVMRMGLILGRSGDALGALGLSAIVICALNPYAAGSISFQATFAASFAIITFAPRLEKIIEKFLQKRCKAGILYSTVSYILKLAAVCVIAVCATMPIFYFAYGYVSLNSVISSIFATPLVPFIMAFGYLAVILNLFTPLKVLAQMVYIPAKALLTLLYKAINLFANLPFIFFANHNFVYIFAAVFLLGALIILCKNYKKLVAAKVMLGAYFAAMAIVFSVGCVSAGVFTANTVKVCVFEEENVVLIIDDGHAALVGVPPPSGLRRQLLRYGIAELELVILPDESFTANNTAARLLQTYKPQNIVAAQTVLSENYIKTATGQNVQFLTEYSAKFYTTTITVKGGLVVIESGNSTVVQCGEELPFAVPENAAVAVVNQMGEQLCQQNIYLRRTPFNYFEILLK